MAVGGITPVRSDQLDDSVAELADLEEFLSISKTTTPSTSDLAPSWRSIRLAVRGLLDVTYTAAPRTNVVLLGILSTPVVRLPAPETI